MPPRNTPGSTTTPKMKAEAAERRKAAPLHRKHPHKGKGEGKAEGE